MATARTQTTDSQYELIKSNLNRKKLKTALRLLREVSQDEIEHAEDVVLRAYDETNTQLQEFTEQATAKALEVADKVKNELFRGKEEIKHGIERHPWGSIAGAALAGVIMGFVLFHESQQKRS